MSNMGLFMESPVANNAPSYFARGMATKGRNTIVDEREGVETDPARHVSKTSSALSALMESSQDNSESEKSKQTLAETWSEKESTATGGDVWYRRFLKLVLPSDQRESLRQAFDHRVTRPSGIPIHEIMDLHGAFRPNYRQFSPLLGLIFSCNHFITNLYRYGDSNDPAVQLIRQLWHILPGGEIQPTHAMRNAASCLTPSLIGAILERWSDLVRDLYKWPTFEERRKWVAQELQSLMSEHPDYLLAKSELQVKIEEAAAALEDVKRRKANETAIREQIKFIEGDVIKRRRHKIKRLQKDQTRADNLHSQGMQGTPVEENKSYQEMIDFHEAIITEAEKEVARLRDFIVTSRELKVANKAYARAEAAVRLEEENFQKLRLTLAGSLCAYDCGSEAERSRTHEAGRLFPHSTTVILLAFMWQKYDSVQMLTDYFKATDRMGALQSTMEEILNVIEKGDVGSGSSHAALVNSTLDIFRAPRLQQWSPEDISLATLQLLRNPGSSHRPAIIPFSYITWAAYSEFPDCGETALRNLMNQLLFNPQTGLFDYEVLQKLREDVFPNMKRRLIDFYQKHSIPQESLDQNVALDWIEVVSNLNEGRPRVKGTTLVRYRREREERNIASPLSNLVRVFNALFGVEPLDDQAGLLRVVSSMNEARGFEMAVDISGIKPDGFGSLILSDGQTQYELQSYKPVHFGFVQTQASRASSVDGSRAFRNFHRLMRYSGAYIPMKTDLSNPLILEQLALASLCVPFQVKAGKSSPIFLKLPRHYPLLFVDLHRKSHREAAWRTIKQNPLMQSDLMVQSLWARVEAYVEPSFRPPSAKKEEAVS